MNIFLYRCEVVQELLRNVLQFCNCSNLLQSITWKDVLLNDFQNRLDIDLNVLFFVYNITCIFVNAKWKSLF